MNRKIMFGVCTYNRKKIIDYSAQSMRRIKDLDTINVCVFDDNSNSYTIDYLRKIYPYASMIEGSNINRGADANALRMLKYFIDSSCEWLFIADSDLVYHEKLVSIIERVIDQYKKSNYKGVVSLFNTCVHPMVEEIDDFIGRKREVGAAGTLLDKEIAKLIMDTKDESEHYDVHFSRILRVRGYDILCTSSSYVQHIGIEGYNSLYYAFDWGQSFDSESIENAKIIYNILDGLMNRISDENNRSAADRLYEDIKMGRIGVKVLINMLFRSVKYKIYKT